MLMVQKGKPMQIGTGGGYVGMIIAVIIAFAVVLWYTWTVALGSMP